MSEAIAFDSHLATKSDLQLELQKLRAELLKWIVGAMIAQTGVLGGLIVGMA